MNKEVLFLAVDHLLEDESADAIKVVAEDEGLDEAAAWLLTELNYLFFSKKVSDEKAAMHYKLFDVSPEYMIVVRDRSSYYFGESPTQ